MNHYLSTKAAEVVEEVLAKGSDKDGQASAWRFKAPSYHLGKAANHLWLAASMYGKIIPVDDEGVLIHLRHAAVRCLMALAILESQ